MLQFHSWNKVEAGHYVYKTDDGYTATVHKGRNEDGVYWRAEVASPSGRVLTHAQWYDFETMVTARKWALDQIMEARA